MSVRTVIQEGGKSLSHPQEAFGFLCIPYSTVQTPRLLKNLGGGAEERPHGAGCAAWWGVFEACALAPRASWAQQPGSLRFSECLPGFDQYFHLAAEKKFPVENVVEAALFS